MSTSTSSAFKNLCDMHTHTTFSKHAYSSIRENCQAAARNGLEMVGITEHLSQLVGDPAAQMRDFQHFPNLKTVPAHYAGVDVLCGAEIDIVDAQGALFGQDIQVTHDITGAVADAPSTIFERTTGRLAYLIISLHNAQLAREMTCAEATNMYVAALAQPRVLMIGHLSRSHAKYELAPIVQACKDLHRVLELNELSFDHDTPEELARETDMLEACAEAGVRIAINTDAHIDEEVGVFPCALKLVEELHFPHELICTRDAKSFKQAIEDAKIC